MPMTREEVLSHIAHVTDTTHEPPIDKQIDDMSWLLGEVLAYLQSSHEAELVQIVEEVTRRTCGQAVGCGFNCLHRRARELLNKIKGE